MRRILALCLLALGAAPAAWAAAPKPAVQIGLDAEFSLDNSISAQAIEQGMRIAMSEINAQGGMLGGRKLELVTRDNGSIPARGTGSMSLAHAAGRLASTSADCSRSSSSGRATSGSRCRRPMRHRSGRRPSSSRR